MAVGRGGGLCPCYCVGGIVKLLLAPHFDDEALFAAFICLREKPLVLFCFDGAPRHGTFETRWAEAQAATRVLGCEAVALSEVPETLEERLSMFSAERVWAPLPEDGGNTDHNLVGEIAERLWPGKVAYFTTYTDAGRSTIGTEIEAPPAWVALKRQALDCYLSQIAHSATRPHFERGPEEFEVVPKAAECLG